MATFRVWLRPLGESCRVRVDGFENARWLLNRLSQSFAFAPRRPFAEPEETSVCSFDVPYSPTLSRSIFQKFLAAIPEIRLMTGPE